MKDIVNNILYMARRFKTATTLNFISLTLAFATFCLLMSQVIYQVTYNHDVVDYQRLYRLESNYLYGDVYNDNACLEFTEVLSSMPLVESYSVAVNINNANYVLHIDGTDQDYPYTWGNNTVVSTLTNHRIDGNIHWTDNDQAGIIIPASIARDYFGTTKAAGKKINTGDSLFVVRGVYEDFPENSELWNCIYMYDDQPQVLNTEYKCIIKFSRVPDNLNTWADTLKQVILKHAPNSLREKGEDEKNIETGISDIQSTDFRLTPLKNSYFENTSFSIDNNRGYKGILIFLLIMSVIVFLMVSINFLNFTLAESPMRVRSLNTRLVLGAQRNDLRMGMIAEDVIVALIACILAFVLCAALMKLPSSQFITSHLFSPKMLPLIPLTLGFAMLVGMVAGAYPAKFATSFPLAFVLKGAFGLTSKGIKLRTAIVGFQLFISMFMMSYTCILFLQTYYILNSDYGYKKNQILINSLPNINANATLHEKLMGIEGILDLSFSDALLGTTDAHNTIKTNSHGHNISYRYILAEANYLQTMGISLAEGRYFSADDTTAVIINEAARQQWHWLNLGDKLPMTLLSSDSATIVGVCKDLRYATTRINNNKPFVFVLDRQSDVAYMNQMTVLVSPLAEKEQVRQQINKVVKSAFDRKEKVQDTINFDNTLEKTYENELWIINIMVFISIICLIITLIGVFCITMFETEYRSKEIGIRKVSGATTGEIVMMLCRQYGWLILISFIASIPFAFLGGYLALKYFAEHTSIKWWIFPISLLLIGGFTLATAALKSWTIARKNPTTSIKNE